MIKPENCPFSKSSTISVGVDNPLEAVTEVLEMFHTEALVADLLKRVNQLLATNATYESEGGIRFRTSSNMVTVEACSGVEISMFLAAPANDLRHMRSHLIFSIALSNKQSLGLVLRLLVEKKGEQNDQS